MPHASPVDSVSVTRVIAAVISRDDRLLICQRPLHKRHGGLWEFPGGKIEEGESTYSAAERELSEELGVAVRAVGDIDLAVADPGSSFVIEFVQVEIDGEPTCLEHAALAWHTPHELEAMSLAPSDRRYVEHLLARA